MRVLNQLFAFLQMGYHFIVGIVATFFRGMLIAYLWCFAFVSLVFPFGGKPASRLLYILCFSLFAFFSWGLRKAIQGTFFSRHGFYVIVVVVFVSVIHYIFH